MRFTTEDTGIAKCGDENNPIESKKRSIIQVQFIIMNLWLLCCSSPCPPCPSW